MPRTVVTLGVVSLFTDISSEMVAAVLPLFVTIGLGLSPLVYGLIDGVYQGAGVLVRLIGGYGADKTGRPKAVAVVGYGISAVCKALMLMVSGLVGLSAVIALDRAGKGLRTGPRDAIIASVSPPDIMGRSFGVHRALDTVGAMIGPLLAWGLFVLVPYDFSTVFVVSLCFAAVGVVALTTFVPEQRREEVESEPVRWRSVVELLRGPAYRRIFGAAAALSVVTIGDGFLYLLLLRSDSISTSVFPLMFIGTSVVYLSLAIPAGRLADRIGRPTVFLGGYVLLLGAYVAASGSARGLGTVACLALLGAYYAATDGVLPAAAAPLVPEALRSTGIAGVQTIVALGRAGGALAFGAVWTVFGTQVAVWTFVVLLGAALVLVAPRLLRPDARVTL